MVVAESEAVGFRWRPAVIVACGALALLLPEYHGANNWFTDLLRWMGGGGFAGACQRCGLNYAFVIQAGLPIIAIVSLREKLTDYGLGLGDVRRGLRICLAFCLIYVPCFIALLANESFRGYYAGVAERYATWPQFFAGEVIAILFLSFRTEFLFRGFLLFGTEKDYGPYAAMLLPLIPYVLIHAGKAELEALGSLPVGLALGYLAIRTRSIWYGIILHGSIALLLNAAILLRTGFRV